MSPAEVNYDSALEEVANVSLILAKLLANWESY